MEIDIARERCCGAAQCVLAAPVVFDQAEDGLVVLLDPAPPASEHARVAEAADACPSRTITIRGS
jgi:ferredoxin